jgi:hypothetical protein
MIFAKQISPLELFVEKPIRPSGLWSPWDMVDLYGYRIVEAIEQVQKLKVMIGFAMVDQPDAPAPKYGGDPPNFTTLTLNIVHSLAEELQLESTNLQINTLMRQCFLRLPASGFLEALDQLLIRINEDLRKRKFAFVEPGWDAYYGQSDPFGLGRSKLKDCLPNIKQAGNCLAVAEGTACVFHLMRAMEMAVRKLGSRLKITINAQTTWRVLTGAMDGKIKSMPDTNAADKRKKDNWAEARANLHHVGSVWRNNTMHPATSYTPSQARDVYNAVRVFMDVLAQL